MRRSDDKEQGIHGSLLLSLQSFACLFPFERGGAAVRLVPSRVSDFRVGGRRCQGTSSKQSIHSEP